MCVPLYHNHVFHNFDVGIQRKLVEYDDNLKTLLGLDCISSSISEYYEVTF